MMRKAFVVFILLVVVAVGGISGAFVTINQAKDKVEFTEEVLYGTKEAAEDLIIQCQSQYGGQCYWNTTYQVGEEPKMKTEFAFCLSGIHGYGEIDYCGVEMYVMDSPFYVKSIQNSMEEMRGIEKAYKELYDTMEANDMKSKEIWLKDYIEYYPLEVGIRIPGYPVGSLSIVDGYEQIAAGEIPEPGTEAYVYWKLQDYFKIPVRENERVEITVGTDEKGEPGFASSSSLSDDSYSGWCYSSITEEACYFTLDVCTSRGNVVDVSKIEGGYGIYCLPYTKKEVEKKNETTLSTEVKVDELAMVYPLEPEQRIQHLGVSPEQTKLILHTMEETKYIISVIDIATMTKVQQIEIPIEAELVDGELMDGALVYDGDDFVAIALCDEQVAVLSVKDEVYQLDFVTEIYEREDGKIFGGDFYSNAIDYDGEKLACSYRHIMREGDWLETCGFDVAVYDKTGLLYYGEYQSSLSAGEPTKCGGYYCEPLHWDALTAKWK